MEAACPHLQAVDEVRVPVEPECGACAPSGGEWVHLRTCQVCGVTLCCDDSPARHMSAHARKEQHHVIASGEPGERWLYCFAHDQTIDY